MCASAVACTYVCISLASDAFRIRVTMHTLLSHVHTRKLMERVVRPSRWQRPRERAYWTGVIKQQDNDGDLRGPTANGLTRRFLCCASSTRVGARERWRDSARDLLISPVRHARRCDLAWLDSTRDDAARCFDELAYTLGDYLFYVKYAAIYLSNSTNGTGKCD